MALENKGDASRARDELLAARANVVAVIARVAQIAAQYDELIVEATANVSGEFDPGTPGSLTAEKNQYKADLITAANGI